MNKAQNPEDHPREPRVLVRRDAFAPPDPVDPDGVW